MIKVDLRDNLGQFAFGSNDLLAQLPQLELMELQKGCCEDSLEKEKQGGPVQKPFFCKSGLGDVFSEANFNREVKKYIEISIRK